MTRLLQCIANKDLQVWRDIDVANGARVEQVVHERVQVAEQCEQVAHWDVRWRRPSSKRARFT